MENIKVDNLGESNFKPTAFGFAHTDAHVSNWHNATGVTPKSPAACTCTCNCFGWSCVACDITKLGVVALPALLKGSEPHNTTTTVVAPPKPPVNPYTKWIWGLGLTGVAALGIGVFIHYKSIKAGKASA